MILSLIWRARRLLDTDWCWRNVVLCFPSCIIQPANVVDSGMNLKRGRGLVGDTVVSKISNNWLVAEYLGKWRTAKSAAILLQRYESGNDGNEGFVCIEEVETAETESWSPGACLSTVANRHSSSSPRDRKSVV